MNRLGSLDHLRIALATLVIAHHVGQAYGPTGGYWPIHNPEQAPWLGAFFTVNAGFFMGLFFWVAGYFTPAPFDRKGGARYLRDRLFRIGVPLVVYFLAASVPITYFYGSAQAHGLSFAAYYFAPWRWEWTGVYQHLWFLGHLLVYAFVYAAWRALRGPAKAARAGAAPAGHRPLIALVIVLTAVSALVRMPFPQDRWVFVGVPVEPAHLPQYVALFAMGIAAARTGWLGRVPSRVGYVWLGIGLAASVVPFLRLLPAAFQPPDLMHSGGYDWRTVVWAAWEALDCVGLSVGLIVLFRDRLAIATRWSRELAADSYGVYIVHILIVVGIEMLFEHVPLGPSAKFLAVLVIAWPFCFFTARGLRRLPGARAVL